MTHNYTRQFFFEFYTKIILGTFFNGWFSEKFLWSLLHYNVYYLLTNYNSELSTVFWYK